MDSNCIMYTKKAVDLDHVQHVFCARLRCFVLQLNVLNIVVCLQRDGAVSSTLPGTSKHDKVRRWTYSITHCCC